MTFRSWVREHAGQSVRVEWQNFNRASGGARVLLIGFDEGAEDDYPDGVLLALLEELEGTNRTGLRQTGDGTVAIRTLAHEIDRLRLDRPEAEVVWLSVPHLKRIQADNGDLVVCSVYDCFVVDYEDPGHAMHGKLACPLHDEPRWRDGRGP